jgi:FtsP/CotA-like multicopper oxidase with cupredoxin domain
LPIRASKRKEDAMLTRRELLKTTAMAAPALLHFGRSRSWASDFPSSPAFTPFRNELRLGDGVPGVVPDIWKGRTGPDSSWPSFDEEQETIYYDIEMRKELAHILPAPYPPTLIWGYNGQFPGPTIEAQLDRRIVVRFRNNLWGREYRMPARCHHNEQEPRVDAEDVTTSIHHHGGHTVAKHDGHPCLTFGPGKYRDYVYANTSTRGGTLWYHDHCEDDTARNVFRGLAGFYLLRSDEEDRTLRESGIVLPKGERVESGGKFYGYQFDVPLVIQDRLFNADASLNYPLLNHEGVLGDVYCVNGKAQPRLAVEPRRYRFRLLNGSNARVYEFALGGDLKFLQIGSDGGLLPQAVLRSSIRMAPAERVEVVVDFTNYSDQRIVLYNILEQTDGRGPADEAGGVRTPIMRFDVAALCSSPDDSRVPRDGQKLLPLNSEEDYRPADAVITRDILLHRQHGVWVVNGSCYDPARSNTCPPVKLGTTEIWRIKNSSGGWVHPLHIHLEEFKMLDRNGVPVGLHEQGLKDTFLIGENETVRVITKWRDQPKAVDGHNDGFYVFHCHNLEHEDMAMMGQMLSVLPDDTSPSIVHDFMPRIDGLTWPVKCQEPL